MILMKTQSLIQSCTLNVNLAFVEMQKAAILDFGFAIIQFIVKEEAVIKKKQRKRVAMTIVIGEDLVFLIKIYL